MALANLSQTNNTTKITKSNEITLFPAIFAIDELRARWWGWFGSDFLLISFFR